MDSVQNILVTGATGLLGAHLLVQLTSNESAKPKSTQKRTIVGLRRDNSDMEEVKRIFSFYTDKWKDLYDMIEWRYGDMLDPESLSKALKDIDLIYHCAAIVSFDPKERENIIKANVKGTKNLIKRITNDERRMTLVHISSTSALGDSLGDSQGDDPNNYVNEKTPRNEKRIHTGYSVSKYESEKIVWDAIDKGLNAWIVNPGIILGPGFWNKGSSKLFSTIKNGLKFYTRGGTGYVDVRDVVKLLIEGTEANLNANRYCLVGANLYFRDFFNMVADELKVKRPSIKAGKLLSGLAWRVSTIKSRITKSYPLITRETAESANRISFFSSEKIEKELNFKFKAIDETIKWICRFI